MKLLICHLSSQDLKFFETTDPFVLSSSKLAFCSFGRGLSILEQRDWLILCILISLEDLWYLHCRQGQASSTKHWVTKCCLLWLSYCQNLVCGANNISMSLTANWCQSLKYKAVYILLLYFFAFWFLFLFQHDFQMKNQIKLNGKTFSAS